MLLRDLHLLPPLISASEPTDHLLLRNTLKVVEPVLNLLGAICLWMMHRFAAPLFAAEAILITVAGFYLSFIDPSPRMHSLQIAHPVIGVYTYPLTVAFEVALTIYVWRITRRSQKEQLTYSEIA
jgi:hypothetical protein